MQKETEKNIALYRKYRPSDWPDVVGQDHVVRVISDSLENGKVSHAYLLYGPRGTGKTTIARIIASKLKTSNSDIYELDAASNRGIDDVREIKENVQTLPFDSDFKIYILDEVHMFTKEAWNALLKTIEEPPAHVIFILATTEIEKVPETIVSRCQTHVFKKPNDQVLIDVIESVAKKEGYKLEDGVSAVLAMIADGAFRDALSNLQKIISFSKDKNISLEEVEKVTGAPGSLIINGFIEALSNGDIDKCFSLLSKAKAQNIEILVFLKMLLYKLRYLLVLRHVPSMKNEVSENLSAKDFSFLEEINLKKSAFTTSKTLNIFLDAYQDSRNSSIPELPLELALVKIFDAEK